MGSVRYTASQTEERVNCDDDKNGNISTQPVTSMDHSGKFVCPVHKKPLCQYNPRCCVHKPRETNCNCPLKSSCCCLHHLGDCCFCVFVPEGQGCDASKSEKINIQGRDTEREGNDAMADNDTPNHSQSSQTVEEHKPSNMSVENKALEGNQSPKMHINSVPRITMDNKLSPRETNKSWDEMVAEEEEWGMVSGDHLVDPKKPVEPEDIVAENADLGFIKRAEDAGPNKTTERGDILTPDEDTDEEETIKPANSVAPDEAAQSGEITRSETKNEPGEAIESGQRMMTEDKIKAGETVELNGTTGPEVIPEIRTDNQKVDDNGHGENTEEREKSRPRKHVVSNGNVASKPASAPLTKVDETGKNQTTTGQTNAGKCSLGKAPCSSHNTHTWCQCREIARIW